jgi:hypothetical protein
MKRLLLATAALMFACVNANAVTVDATYTLEVDFAGISPPFFHPSVQLIFASSNQWDAGEFLNWQLFDGDQNLIAGASYFTTSTQGGIVFSAPVITTSTATLFVSSVDAGSFDVTNAFFYPNGFGGDGRFAGTFAGVASPVPGPIVGAGLPGLLGLLGFGGWKWRRRKQVA